MSVLEVILKPGRLKRDVARAAARAKELEMRCPKCGTPTRHACIYSRVCVEICPKCDGF